MTDNGMTERTVFSLAFPAPTLQLCLFHTLRSFAREVMLDKMGIRAGQRDSLLGIFNAMAAARCEQQFDEQCVLLQEMDTPVATAYFQRNWLLNKHEWVSCFKVTHFTLGEQTKNRINSLNGRIKTVCSRFASLDNFFSDFFCVLRVLFGERDHSSIIARVSKPTQQQLLTPHAFDLVLSQIARRETV